MIIAILAVVAAPWPLPKEDIQEVLASWGAGKMYCERGNKRACAVQRSYEAKMRTQYGLCPPKNGERDVLIVCKTGRKVDVSFE